MAAATDFMNRALGRQHPVAEWRPASSIAGFAAFGRDDDRVRLHATLGIAPTDRVLHLAEIGNVAPTGAQFDVVTAGLDVVQADDSGSSVSDLLRLCAPGGRIGLAVPTPGSFLARIDALIGKYVPGPARQNRGLVGTRAAMNDAFESFAVAMSAQDRKMLLCYESIEHWLDEFRGSYEPLRRAWERVGPAWRCQFSTALLETAATYAKPARFGIVIPCDYLEFTAHTAPLQ